MSAKHDDNSGYPRDVDPDRRKIAERRQREPTAKTYEDHREATLRTISDLARGSWHHDRGWRDPVALAKLVLRAFDGPTENVMEGPTFKPDYHQLVTIASVVVNMAVDARRDLLQPEVAQANAESRQTHAAERVAKELGLEDVELVKRIMDAAGVKS